MARFDVDGGWADIRDPRKLTERQSEPMDDAQYALMGLPGMAAIMANADDAEHVQTLSPAEQMAAMGKEGFHALRELRRQTVLAYVSAWSASDVVSLDALLDCPVSFVTAVENEITKVVKATGRAGVNTEPTIEKDTPTGPLSA